MNNMDLCPYALIEFTVCYLYNLSFLRHYTDIGSRIYVRRLSSLDDSLNIIRYPKQRRASHGECKKQSCSLGAKTGTSLG
jgi:hypothetical protein